MPHAICFAISESNTNWKLQTMNATRKLIKAIRNPKKAILFLISKSYDVAVFLKTSKRWFSSDLKELDEVKERSLVRTDMSDHLVTLFIESLTIRPKLIVELGVREGESTFVLERVARLFGSKLVSVDIEDCSRISSYQNWMFVKSDDIGFAQKFESWCEGHSIQPQIDILFIDTSHLFEHTLQEINHWFPFLSDRAKVFFHDTNLQEVYSRKDGSWGTRWNSVDEDNKRGVIGAIEEYFCTSFSEKEDFVDFRKGWLIKHYASCGGFMILEKIGLAASDRSATS